MSILSDLSVEQRKKLLKEYSLGDKNLPQSLEFISCPIVHLIKTPDEESFNERSDFLKELSNIEMMISSDIERLQAQLSETDSSEDNELLEAFEESKGLLRKINQLQRWK